jgi:glutamate carboxypeptidase
MIAAADKVLEAVRARRDDYVAFLTALLRDESPSLSPESVRHALRTVKRSLQNAGMVSELLPGPRTGGHLYAVPRKRVRGRPYQLLLGHCDTVWAEGTLSTTPVVVDEEYVRGPGAFDMKSGLANIVLALRVVHDLGLEPPLTPVVLVTSDEEVGSIESQKHIERLARGAERALVMEPALGPRGALKTVRKGTGHFDVRVTGRAAHAGIAPEEGASAILEMSHVIQRLFALNDPARGTSVNVGTVSGGMRSNVVAEESNAGVDVRVLTRDDADRIEEAIHNITPVIPGVRLSIEGGMSRAPMEPTPRNQALWRRARELGAEMGIELQQGTSGGASDGNLTSQFTATLDGLGGVGDGAHARHEHIHIDRTLERCALLALLILSPSIPPEPPA